MTLKEAIDRIEFVAAGQPAINCIVRNDVFRLNTLSDVRYGVFAWLQGQHEVDMDTNMMTLKFTFFYVDRLKADKGNQVEIQSVGIQTLDTILRKLDELGLFVVGSTSYTTFNQRFTDECAGVFCNVMIDVPVTSLCVDEFADYNVDFNEDFLIF